MAFWNRRRKKEEFIQKAFGDFLAPEIIGKLSEPAVGIPHVVEEGEIHFVLCQVLDNELAEMRATLSGIASLAVDRGGNVVDILPSIVYVTFGFPRSAFVGQDEGDFVRSRTTLAEALLNIHGQRVRIVHGCSHGAFGVLGNDRRFFYGSTIPGFNRVIERLVSLEFGAMLDMSQDE